MKMTPIGPKTCVGPLNQHRMGGKEPNAPICWEAGLFCSDKAI